MHTSIHTRTLRSLVALFLCLLSFQLRAFPIPEGLTPDEEEDYVCNLYDTAQDDLNSSQAELDRLSGEVETATNNRYDAESHKDLAEREKNAKRETAAEKETERQSGEATLADYIARQAVLTDRYWQLDSDLSTLNGEITVWEGEAGIYQQFVNECMEMNPNPGDPLYVEAQFWQSKLDEVNILLGNYYCEQSNLVTEIDSAYRELESLSVNIQTHEAEVADLKAASEAANDEAQEAETTFTAATDAYQRACSDLVELEEKENEAYGKHSAASQLISEIEQWFAAHPHE